jgi:hypothetical protein
MSVSCECCVLRGSVICDVLITRPEESYRLWFVWVLFWSLNNEEALTQAHWGLMRHRKRLKIKNVGEKPNQTNETDRLPAVRSRFHSFQVQTPFLRGHRVKTNTGPHDLMSIASGDGLQLPCDVTVVNSVDHHILIWIICKWVLTMASSRRSNQTSVSHVMWYDIYIYIYI